VSFIYGSFGKFKMDFFLTDLTGENELIVRNSCTLLLGCSGCINVLFLLGSFAEFGASSAKSRILMQS